MTRSPVVTMPLQTNDSTLTFGGEAQKGKEAIIQKLMVPDAVRARVAAIKGGAAAQTIAVGVLAILTELAVCRTSRVLVLAHDAVRAGRRQCAPRVGVTALTDRALIASGGRRALLVLASHTVRARYVLLDERTAGGGHGIIHAAHVVR